jgi:hypothetical protein
LEFVDVADKAWVVFTAAAYRTPDDLRPGIGTAWEPVPGKTPFTRDSEVQNAETAAWGRAIVAALAGDTKKGIASAEEVRNRRAPNEEPADPLSVARAALVDAYNDKHGLSTPEEIAAAYEQWAAAPLLEADEHQIRAFIAAVEAGLDD